MSNYKNLNSFKDKKSRAEYVKSVLLSEGYKPLEDYKGNGTPILVEILVGEYKGYKATIRWSGFYKGSRPDFRSLTEKEKFLKDKFEEEGYKVINIPDNVRVTDKIDLISPEGNEWSVSYDTFRRGVRCPLDSNKSWGERCVGSILKQNGIPFEAQKTIYYGDGSVQYMDFYVEYKRNKYCIEYHGKQHYEEDPSNKLFASLEEQKKADEKKKRYCNNHGIVYVEIPYTINKINDIAYELKKYFSVIDVDKRYIVETFNNEKEIVEYYKNHTEEETAKMFGIAGVTVRNMAYRAGYRKKIYKHDEDIKKSALEYYKTHTAQETADKFNIPKHTINMWASKHKVNKPRPYTDREVIEFYMNHTINETKRKFNIRSSSTILRIMRKNGIKKGGKR